MTKKDFGAIESDYAFFMAHATEAASDVAEYVRTLADAQPVDAPVRLLDFGCGDGEFSARLLTALSWPPAMLRLTLMEPVRAQCDAAAVRLAAFTAGSVATAYELAAVSGPFDIIVANHVLYYVDDLQATVEQLIARLASGATLRLTMAGWDNALIQLWQRAFELLGRPVPYYVSDDLAALLDEARMPFERTQAAYQLRFADTAENRRKILRFLLAEHLHEIPLDAMAREFDRYAVAGEIVIDTASDHYVVPRR